MEDEAELKAFDCALWGRDLFPPAVNGASISLRTSRESVPTKCVALESVGSWSFEVGREPTSSKSSSAAFKIIYKIRVYI